jgi:hypothetical protein
MHTPSNRSTVGFCRKARAMAMRSEAPIPQNDFIYIVTVSETYICFWPAGRLWDFPANFGVKIATNVVMMSVESPDKYVENTNSDNELINSRMLGLRQARSIYSWVISDLGLVAPSRILKRTVPADNVCHHVEIRVNNWCAIVMVVQPLAAWSGASCKIFTEFEFCAEAASPRGIKQIESQA